MQIEWQQRKRALDKHNARRQRRKSEDVKDVVLYDEDELKNADHFENEMDGYVAPPKSSVTVRVGGRRKRRKTTRRARLPSSLKRVAADARLAELKEAARRYGFNDNLVVYPMRGSAMSKKLYGETYMTADDSQKAMRNAMRFKGRGDYKSALKWGSRGIGALAGGAYGFMQGGYPGAFEGARTGYGLGASFSKMRGWGDYTAGVSGNQLIGADSQQQISVNQTSLSGDVYIEHTEFVQNISCSASGAGQSAFQVVKFPINAGLSTTFPFLSQLAQNFVLAEFQGLVFQYKPTSGESGAASNALGKVIFATNYDPNETAFLNSVQMANEDYANTCKPSVGMVHGVETHPAQSLMDLKYIRTGAVSRDLSFFDLGNFWVATEGIPFSAAGTQILGELWVSYRVRLSRANLYGSLLGLNISQDLFEGTSSATQLVASTTLSKSSNTLGCTITNVSSTAGLLTFPANISLGTFLVQIAWEESTVGWGGTQKPANSTNPANLTFFKPGASTPAAADTGATNWRCPGTGVAANNLMIYMTWVTVNAPGNLQGSFQFNVSLPLNANTTWTALITQYNQKVSESVA